MNVEKSIPPACHAALLRLNELIDGALPPPEALETETHLMNCPVCAAERRVRERIRAGLRSAVQAQRIATSLEARVLSGIHPRRNRQWSLIAAAAALLIGIPGTVAYRFGYLRVTAGQQDSYLAEVSERVSSVMRAGLIDHVHCAFFRKWPKQAPPLEQAVLEMTPKYRPIAQMVQSRLPAGYRILSAHECTAGGRRFVHLTMAGSDGGLLSLVLSSRQAGETFANSPLRSVAAGNGLPVFTEGVHRFRIAGFETRGYLAFLVSSLSEEENLQLAVTLAPPVKELLDTLGT